MPEHARCAGRASERRVGKPVSEDLIGGEAPLFEACLHSLRRFAVTAEVGSCEIGRYRGLFLNQPRHVAPQARAVLENVIDFDPRVADRFFPTWPWFDRRGGFEFELMPQNAPELRAKRGALRFPQALDLLGKVLPVERQVGARALGPSQSGRLVLGPPHEIAVVQFACCALARHPRSSSAGLNGVSTSPRGRSATNSGCTLLR